jgi:hypothetical protein
MEVTPGLSGAGVADGVAAGGAGTEMGFWAAATQEKRRAEQQTKKRFIGLRNSQLVRRT